jgi:hypothetical protein
VFFRVLYLISRWGVFNIITELFKNYSLCFGKNMVKCLLLQKSKVKSNISVPYLFIGGLMQNQEAKIMPTVKLSAYVVNTIIPGSEGTDVYSATTDSPLPIITKNRNIG